MTLILIAMTEKFAVQVSDRRLTSSRAVVEEEHNKGFTLNLPGFRFAIAFTGLARVRRFTTSDWLLQQLSTIGSAAREPLQLFQSLTASLNRHFASHADLRRLPVNDKRLTISVVGFNYLVDPPLGLAAEITNEGDADSNFRVSFTQETRPNQGKWQWIGAYGNASGITASDVEGIRSALERNVTVEGIRRILEHKIRKLADDPRSGGNIGKQLDVIVIDHDPAKSHLGIRSSDTVQNELLFPGTVLIAPGGASIAIKSLKIASVGPGARPMSFPRVHRNAPCPCGSGKRYRDCHRGQAH